MRLVTGDGLNATQWFRRALTSSGRQALRRISPSRSEQHLATLYLPPVHHAVSYRACKLSEPSLRVEARLFDLGSALPCSALLSAQKLLSYEHPQKPSNTLSVLHACSQAAARPQRGSTSYYNYSYNLKIRIVIIVND